MPDNSILRIKLLFFSKTNGMTCLRTLKTPNHKVFRECTFLSILWAEECRRCNKNSKFKHLKTLPKMSWIQNSSPKLNQYVINIDVLGAQTTRQDTEFTSSEYSWPYNFSWTINLSLSFTSVKLGGKWW